MGLLPNAVALSIPRLFLGATRFLMLLQQRFVLIVMVAWSDFFFLVERSTSRIFQVEVSPISDPPLEIIGIDSS
mgnify:CR=1 FL=1